MLQVVTPQRMELLRVKLREEIEGPYKEVHAWHTYNNNSVTFMTAEALDYGHQNL